MKSGFSICRKMNSAFRAERDGWRRVYVYSQNPDISIKKEEKILSLIFYPFRI